MRFPGIFKKIKCYKCGNEAIANLSAILTSYPPQYNVDCPKCGRVYMNCSDVNSQEGEIFYD